MRRLFLPNFDFEHQLSEPRHLPSRLQQLNEDLAAAWIAVARDGDLIHTPAAVGPGFFESLHAQGLPSTEPVCELERLTEAVEVCAWGWTDQIRAWADKHGHRIVAPPQSVVREMNSRRFSSSLEAEWNVAPPGAVVLRSAADLDDALCGLPDAAARWVIKAEFGMSARERLLGRGRDLPTNSAAWVRRRLRADGILFFEPWLERVDETGLQFTVPAPGSGPPVLEGITPLLTDAAGQYLGSDFTPDRRLEQRWAEAIEAAHRAAERAQALGYFGPLGIDAMRYGTSDSDVRLRPLQDVNARYTMGRLSLGFRRLLRPGERGQWRHTSTPTVGVPASAGPEPLEGGTPAGARIIRTTPLHVGGRATRHGAVVVISPAPPVSQTDS